MTPAPHNSRLIQSPFASNEQRISKDVKSEECSSNYEAGSPELARVMIICITEKNIPQPHRYSIGSCQLSKLYFHYFLFIPLIRIVTKINEGRKASIQIWREAPRFPANHGRLKGKSEESEEEEEGVRRPRVCQGKSCRVS